MAQGRANKESIMFIKSEIAVKKTITQAEYEWQMVKQDIKYRLIMLSLRFTGLLLSLKLK